MRLHKTSCEGMTLIELMIVIVILGIVSAMIVPNFAGSMATTQLAGAGRDLAGAMDFCYRSAVATGRVHALVIDSDRRHFEMVSEQPPANAAASGIDPEVTAPEISSDPTAAPELAPVSIPGFIQRSLPEGIRLGSIAVVDRELSATDDGKVQFLFFPDGTAEYAELHLLNDSGDQCIVSLDGLTGMIEVGEVGPAPKAKDDGTGDSGGAAS